MFDIDKIVKFALVVRLRLVLMVTITSTFMSVSHHHYYHLAAFIAIIIKNTHFIQIYFTKYPHTLIKKDRGEDRHHYLSFFSFLARDHGLF